MLKTEINAARSNSLEVTVSEPEHRVYVVGLTGAAYYQGMSYCPAKTGGRHIRYCTDVSTAECSAMSRYASEEPATRSRNKKSPLKQQSRSFRRVEGDSETHDFHAQASVGRRGCLGYRIDQDAVRDQTRTVQPSVVETPSTSTQKGHSHVECTEQTLPSLIYSLERLTGPARIRSG